jgi:hypothetical protein
VAPCGNRDQPAAGSAQEQQKPGDDGRRATCSQRGVPLPTARSAPFSPESPLLRYCSAPPPCEICWLSRLPRTQVTVEMTKVYIASNQRDAAHEQWARCTRIRGRCGAAAHQFAVSRNSEVCWTRRFLLMACEGATSTAFLHGEYSSGVAVVVASVNAVKFLRRAHFQRSVG